MNFTLEQTLIYLAAINAVTFIAWWIDKKQSRSGGFRISEKTLLLMSLMGGSPGGFIASRLFRHKTKKGSFRAMFWLVVMLQIFIIVAYFNGLLKL